jgi:hypothetical protein
VLDGVDIEVAVDSNIEVDGGPDVDGDLDTVVSGLSKILRSIDDMLLMTFGIIPDEFLL